MHYNITCAILGLIWMLYSVYIYTILLEGIAIPLQAYYRSRWFQEVEASRYKDSRHMKVVRLSALRTGSFPSKKYSMFISVRGWVDLTVIVQSEGLCHWKIPITSTGIKTHHLPACSTAPQPNMSPLDPRIWKGLLFFIFGNSVYPFL
jgi:hypothetical protein